MEIIEFRVFHFQEVFSKLIHIELLTKVVTAIVNIRYNLLMQMPNNENCRCCRYKRLDLSS